ncbi:MAG: ParB N-terminal domain-containing protein [Synergistaceae bacterium]|nr:ParB N-terminal domain-containing protein [Synergistaceae bacterium]
MKKTAIDAQRGTIFMVAPENLTLVTDPNHPLYDPRVHDVAEDSMVCNVMVYGVLEPILVRKDGDKIEVVAGKHRVKAAIEANRRLTAEGKQPILVPTVIKKGSDADLYGILISENEIRKDDTPMAKSEKARKLQNMGYSVQQIAVTFGVSRQAVDSWLMLQDLAQPIQEAVEKEEISATAAAKLAKFSRQEQVERYEDLKKQEQPMTVSNVQQAAKSVDNVPAPRLKNRREIEQKLAAAVPSDDHTKGYRAALLWMLGREEEE